MAFVTSQQERTQRDQRVPNDPRRAQAPKALATQGTPEGVPDEEAQPRRPGLPPDEVENPGDPGPNVVVPNEEPALPQNVPAPARGV